jgi:primosomal protein N' (replication factor Y) (superfamily II helicase)
MTRETDHIFSQIAEKWIRKNIIQWKKIAIIVNKKWFSGWIFCQNCGYVPKCNKCDVSISYHKVNKEKIWLCHICKSQYNYPNKCPSCKSEKIKEFWIWTQKISEILENQYKIKTDIIESEKVNSIKKIKKILKNKNTQLYIWTSLLNTPIKWVKLDLIIFLNADLWLAIPDYSAAKNNFHFLYDTFKSQNCDNFIVQTYNPENYSIRNSCKINKELFLKEDNLFREKNKYPPFSEICVIMYKNEIEERLFTKIDKLHKELLYLKEKYQMNELEIYSTPPLIYKIFGKYRYNIILKWKNLRNFMDIIYTKLRLNQNSFKIDRNAENIL